MATKRTIGSGITARAVHAGVNSVTFEYTLTDTLSDGDIIEMVKIPDGATVLDIIASLPDVDADSVITETVLAIGDGASEARYGSFTALGNVVRATPAIANFDASVPFDLELSDNDPNGFDTVDVTVTGGSSGTSQGNIKLTVLYTMDK